MTPNEPSKDLNAMRFDSRALARALRGDFEGVVESDHDLKRYTTYRVGGRAALYVEPAGVADLAVLGRRLRESGDVPVLVVGRGSNLVVSDAGWPGIAVRLSTSEFSWIAAEDESRVSSGGATSLPLVANWAARRGLAGAEFLVAVPGSIGGAVRMNAGAHGAEMKDCLAAARIFDFDALEVDVRPVETLGLTYRHSDVTDREVVLDAILALRPDEPDAVKARTEANRKQRAATQPGAAQNAGSVFMNPPGDHAGRLVDAAGLKGFRVGSAAVSEIHANFFIADGGGRAQDVFDLVHEVRRRVHERFGIELTPEVRFVGEFAGDSAPRDEVAR
jgi:UDP-N-acetylmuramate dehydrogenase